LVDKTDEKQVNVWLLQPDTEGFIQLSDIGIQGDPFKQDLNKEDDLTWFPLAVVLVLAGAASSRYPFFDTIELIARRLTQRIIGISEGPQTGIYPFARSQGDHGFARQDFAEALG